jgi:hypothetical protein
MLEREWDPTVLAWITERALKPMRAARRRELYELADQIVDRCYPLLSPGIRPLTLLRLGTLTRLAVPIRGHRWFADRRSSGIAAMAASAERGALDDTGMTGRRIAAAVTAATVAVLAVVLVVTRWDAASKVAAIVSALAAVAGAGIAIWAALSTMSHRQRRWRTSASGQAGRICEAAGSRCPKMLRLTTM